MKAIAIVALMAAISLAGCAEKSEPDPVNLEDLDPSSLEAGKGAIAGLLVDDRFRPIHDASILVLESGDVVKTDLDGEFAILDLEPATYTLRVTAEGHEAAPRKIVVEEGLFSETELIARRVSSESNTIITQEFTVFIPCSADFVANGIVANCVLDLSGDSFRAGFTVDYSYLGDNVSFLVTELLTNQDGGFIVQVRENDGSTAGGDRFAVGRMPRDVTYYKMINEYGVANEVDNEQDNNIPWTNPGEFNPDATQQNPFTTIMFIDGMYKDELTGTGAPGVCCGADARFGIKAQFVQSLFIGPPDVDVEKYAVLGE